MKSSRVAASFFALALTVGLATPSTATAQGCTLCRDTTAGSTPQARKALRIAIPLLGIPAIGIFAGALVLARRVKLGSSSES
jgi:hypothetical protein